MPHAYFAAGSATRSPSVRETGGAELIDTLAAITLMFGVVVCSVLAVGMCLLFVRGFAGRVLIACSGLLATAYLLSVLISTLLWDPDYYSIILLAMASPGIALLVIVAAVKLRRWVRKEDPPTHSPAFRDRVI